MEVAREGVCVSAHFLRLKILEMILYSLGINMSVIVGAAACQFCHPCQDNLHGLAWLEAVNKITSELSTLTGIRDMVLAELRKCSVCF